MNAVTDLKYLKSIKTGKGLIKLLASLRLYRRVNKVHGIKRTNLKATERQLILDKTNGHCHFCGIVLEPGRFQADHIRAHCAGGLHELSNYLPSCNLCNKYRWHFAAEELQVILKIGVWARSKMLNDPVFGLEMANSFMNHEMGLRKVKKVRQQKRKSIKR